MAEKEERPASLRDLYDAVVDLGIAQLSYGQVLAHLIHDDSVSMEQKSSLEEKFHDALGRNADAISKLLDLGFPE